MKNRDLEELAQAHCSCRRRAGYQNVVQLATSRDNGQVPKATREYRRGGEMLSLTYHPSPQNLLDRPQSPSFEQQAPHVGLQTKPFAPAQVPSTVTTPVCHGGITSVAVPCATAHTGNRQSRANTGTFIVSVKSACEIFAKIVYDTECMISFPYIEMRRPMACLVLYLLFSCHTNKSPLRYLTTLET